MAETNSTSHRCQHCGRQFQRESSVMRHSCEPLRRWQDRDSRATQIGLRAYQRFYQLAQGQTQPRDWQQFSTSSYYRGFRAFGEYCQATRTVNTAQFTDWLIRQQVPLDRWCRDSVYEQYLHWYTRTENVADALARAVTTAEDWAQETGHPAQGWIRYASPNRIAHAITTGRLTAWAMYNSESGQAWLENMGQDHQRLVMPWLDPDFWAQEFQARAADQDWARDIMRQAGW